MKLVWKLLQQHISPGQLIGFFFANLFGMMIVLLSIQFYRDVVPLFNGKDSFIKEDFLIINKKVSGGVLGSVGNNSFSPADVQDVEHQPFIKDGKVGVFTTNNYDVTGTFGMKGGGFNFSTEMFFESVPNGFVDVDQRQWHFDPSTKTVPIILPKVYINLYNFGFAQSRNMPKISEDLMNMIELGVKINGQGKEDHFNGRIVGFSTRLNTILVPEDFMKWSNQMYGNGEQKDPSKLILKVANPTDSHIVQYLQKKNYETDEDKLEAGKTTYFLRMITGIVLIIGLIISVLSFYILMLSIYLLVQKNTTKLENLLLIGYSPHRVCLPYQYLTLGLNAIVLFGAFGLVCWERNYYMNVVEVLFPKMVVPDLFITFMFGLGIFVCVSIINCIAIRKKVYSIWIHKS
jgi:hypothetical protein